MTMLRTLLRPALAGCLVPLFALASPVHAQASSAPAMSASPDLRNAKRVDLEASAAALDRHSGSTAYSPATIARAKEQAEAIRQRLREGDFRVGDRIALLVEGQASLSDTLTVMDGQRVTIRGFRQVSLAGVLRSELEPMLRAELADFVRTATVTARPLMRVAVLGSVQRPGYLNVAAELTLDQLISFAGGPAPTAATAKARLTRADTVLYTAEQIVNAIAAGTTIADLGLENGDILTIPAQGPPWDRNATLQIISLFLFPVLTIFVIR